MKTLSPWREKPRNKLRIILLYKIEITTLRDTTWVKKLSFSFHSILSFLLCIFSYPLYFSLLFLLAFTHAALSPHTLELHPFSLFFKWPNGLLFLSPFLLFTLFTSSNNKCKLRLCFNQFLFFNTPLAEWPCQLLLLSFLSSFSVSNTPKRSHVDFHT